MGDQGKSSSKIGDACLEGIQKLSMLNPVAYGADVAVQNLDDWSDTGVVVDDDDEKEGDSAQLGEHCGSLGCMGAAHSHENESSIRHAAAVAGADAQLSLEHQNFLDFDAHSFLWMIDPYSNCPHLQIDVLDVGSEHQGVLITFRTS